MKSIVWQLVFVGGFALVAILTALNQSGSESSDQTSSKGAAGQTSLTQSSPKPASADEAFWQMIDRNFAGDQACMACHDTEFQAHQRSGHSHTAFRAEESPLARQLAGTTYQEPDQQRLVRFSLESSGFYATVQRAGQTERQRIDWLLGSGTHAQTPISVLADQNLGIEHFWSYFRGHNQLSSTPGQAESTAATSHSFSCSGRVMSGQEVANCLGCHMTFGPPPGQPLNAARWQPNISCERCHGPRKAHVAAALQGQGEAVKPLLDLKQASVEMDLCAQCHRDERQVDPRQPERDLVRFQPYRLKLSPCYQSNPAEMSCITCHDPHDKTSHDVQMYQQTCAKCHSQPEQTHCSRDVSLDQAGQNCLTCHMPTREWASGVSFTDHWIRVVRKEPSERTPAAE